MYGLTDVAGEKENRGPCPEKSFSSSTGAVPHFSPARNNLPPNDYSASQNSWPTPYYQNPPVDRGNVSF